MFVPKVTKYDLWSAMSQLLVRRVYTYNGSTETTYTKKQWQKNRPTYYRETADIKHHMQSDNR